MIYFDSLLAICHVARVPAVARLWQTNCRADRLPFNCGRMTNAGLSAEHQWPLGAS